MVLIWQFGKNLQVRSGQIYGTEMEYMPICCGLRFITHHKCEKLLQEWLKSMQIVTQVNSVAPHKVITPYFVEIAAGYEDSFILVGR